MVNEDRMRHTFEDLVKIDAPSKGEREVCDYLKKKLRALGAAKITEDNNGSVNGGNSGNLIAVFNANTEGLPSIALTAHMDCVENCRGIEPVLEDGVYRSKGDTVLGGDDKAGVAAILEGLALMKETYIPHGKVTVIFTVQEEIGLCGSSSIEEKYISGIDFGYTLDGDGAAGSAYTAGPSEYTLDFTCKGIAAHAGMAPEKGTNAIAMAGLGISLCPTGRIDDETTCNIGLIEGGTAVNIVPDRCVVHCEARSRNDEKLEALVAKMEAALKEACSVPMEIMEKCCEAIELIVEFGAKGSKLAISDAGVGAAFCKAALKGASLNVYINTKSMADRAYAEELNKKADAMLEKYTKIADETFDSVLGRLK